MQHEVLWGHVCAALIDGNTHGCDLGATGLSIGHVFVPKKDFRPNGYGSIPIDTFLVGWTSIYQGFDPSPNVSGMWKKIKVVDTSKQI